MDKIFVAIFTPEFLFSVIRVSTPLILGAMAALICNRGGMLHIAFEGIMLSAAFLGMLTSALTQNVLIGVLGAIAGGLLIFSSGFEFGQNINRYCIEYICFSWNCVCIVSSGSG